MSLGSLAPPFSFFFFNYLFIYSWLCWVVLAFLRRLSLIAARGDYSVVVCRLFIAVASHVAECRL